MTNEEEMELESVIRRTETPARVDGKENKPKRAKLTARTISSLVSKIKEKRLDRAYAKYNKAYGKMRKSLIEANTLRNEYNKSGEERTVTSAEVMAAYSKVDSYGKRLAKWGVKLLDADIKRIAKAEKAKPIRVPRVLVGKMRKITHAIVKPIEAHRDKKLQKAIAGDMKDATKDMIRDSLTNAMFKDVQSASLKSAIDKETIKDLGLKKESENEDRLASLRKFISIDGKTSALSDEELTRAEKPIADVPPVEPTPTVEKEKTTLTEQDILGGLGVKPKAAESTAELHSNAQKRVTLEDLTKGLKASPVTVESANVEVKKEDTPKVQRTVAENKVPEKKTVETVQEEPKTEATEVVKDEPVAKEKETSTAEVRRKREVASINSIMRSISSLENQMAKVKDSDTIEMVKGYIEGLREELDAITHTGISKKEKEQEAVVEDKVEQQESMDPITVEPPVEEVEKTHDEVVEVEQPTPVIEKHDNLDNVVLKDNESIRVTQTAAPRAVRVESNFQDILARNINARHAEQSSMDRLAELRKERDLLLQKIEADSIERERRAQETKAQEAEMASQISELRTFAEENGVDLSQGQGRSK